LTGEKVTLSAGVWMEDIKLEETDETQEDPTWLIYTDKPDFKVTTESGFPAGITYKFEYDIFMVVISLGSNKT